MSEQTEASARAMPAWKALMIAVIILACVIGFVVLCTLLGLAPEYFIAFFFLLNWSARDLEQAALPGVALGAFFGLGLAFVLSLLIAGLGQGTGGLVFLGLLLPVIALQVAGRAALVINHSTMVILTVMTISHVAAGADFLKVAACLALGIVIAGGGATLVRLGLARRRAGRAVN